MFQPLYKCSLIIYQSGQCTYKHYTEVFSHNHCCHGKAVSITYPGCMSVALVIQHALYMHHITLSSVVCLVLPHFSIVAHKRHESHKQYHLQKTVIDQKICTEVFT